MADKDLFVDPDEELKKSNIPSKSGQDREINQEIEEQVNKNRTEYSNEMLHTKEGRSGILLPFAVISATLFLFASTVTFVWFFNTKTATITITKEVSEAGAINDLIKQLKVASDKEIAEKQDQIDMLINNLENAKSSIQKEKIAIRFKVEEKKSTQEKEISNLLTVKEAQLIAEKLAEVEVEKRLIAYEAIIRKNYNEKLLVYQLQLEKDIKKKEAELDGLENDYKQQLDANSREITRIKNQAANKRREYDKKLIEQNNNIMQDMKSVTKELADLQTRKERDERLRLRMDGYFININNNIQSANFSEARRVLEDMRIFMRSGSYLSSSILTQSAESDLLVNELLTQYVNMKENDEDRKVLAAKYNFKKDPEFISMQNNFNQGIEQTISAINTQNIDEALTNFNQALGHLPSGVSATSALKTILDENEKTLRNQLTLELAKQFETANGLEKESLRREFVNEITQLGENSKSLQMELNLLRGELELKEKTISNNGLEIEKLLIRISELESTTPLSSSDSLTVSRIRKELVSIKKEKNLLEKELSTADNKISSLEKQLTNKIESEGNQLLSEIRNELQEEKSNSSLLKNELSEKEQRILELSAKTQELTSSNLTLMTEKSELISERERLINELSDKSNQIADHESSISSLEKKITSLSAHSGTPVINSEEIEKLQGEMTKLESERDVFSTQISELTSELTDALKTIQEYKDAGRMSRSAERQISSLSKENIELENQLMMKSNVADELALELKSIKEESKKVQQNYSKIEDDLISLKTIKMEYDTIKEEYNLLIRDYNRLDKKNQYALLTMENRFGNFFSSRSMNEFLPEFDEIFEDYTKTVRDQSSGKDKIYADMSNNIKEVSSYSDKTSMIEALDDLIDFDQENRFKVTVLNELKALIEIMESE